MSQQDEERLKPCPFCGGKPEEMVGGSHGSVGCRNEDCGAVIDIHDPTHDPYLSLNRARAAWNRRAPEHEKAAPTGWVMVPVSLPEWFLGTFPEDRRASVVEHWARIIPALSAASPPPASAEQRARLAGLKERMEKMWPGSMADDYYAIARDLAALCEEVMGQP